ncbi:MAG: hypothetical protein J7496_16035 [Novosphingobium sp.]|nr:hypothetical protein [Novosphingobium sp.]MBO9604011.1 hypothetical protein [Novosphingobium sp.]
MEWTWDNTPQMRVKQPRIPTIDVLSERRLMADGKSTQSAAERLMLLNIQKGLSGENKKELMIALKRGARRERKLIAEGHFDKTITFETLNLDFERVGDVAEMLGIAHRVDAPPASQRDWFERDQRYNLEEWVIKLARKENRCSNEHLADILKWQRSGCQQWRFKSHIDHMVGDLPDEFRTPKRLGRPPGSRNKPKKTVHPYDRKLTILHNGERKTVRVMEALMIAGHKYLIQHPGDAELSNLLLDITERAEAAFEKRCQGPEPGMPLRMDDDDRLYMPMRVPCLEVALMGFGGADILYPYRPYARAVLEPWLVQAALDRRKTRFTRSQQQRIVNRTRQPGKVNWPDRFDRDVIEYRGPGRPAAEMAGGEDADADAPEEISEEIGALEA